MRGIFSWPKTYLRVDQFNGGGSLGISLDLVRSIFRNSFHHSILAKVKISTFV